MDKPIKPIETLAEEFGGLKENFTEDKIETGYQPDVPDILAGANLNYLLDTMGKKFKYNDIISDYINNTPIDNTIFVDENNKLKYTNIAKRVHYESVGTVNGKTLAQLKTPSGELVVPLINNATSTEKGVVKVDNTTIVSSEDGTISTKWDSDDFLNTRQITNCILSVEELVKVETSSSSALLTLKKGSIVYVSTNGTFNEVTIQSDVSAGSGGLFTQNADRNLYACYVPSLNEIRNIPVTQTYSQATAPSASSMLNSTYCGWFDTTNNVMKYTYDGGVTWTICSLPFALGNPKSGGAGWYQHIQQVFNGFGVVGQKTFSTRGVKALLPNGRNSDGTLNNKEVVSTSFGIYDETGKSSWLCFWDGNRILTYGVNNYFEQDYKPTFSGNHATWLNTKENIMYLTSDGGTTWNPTGLRCYLGKLVKTNTGVITEFEPNEPVELVKLVDLDRVIKPLETRYNETKAYITETYRNGTTGYIIWSDGYCEQWGEVIATSSWQTFSFLKTFADTYYSIFGSCTNNAKTSFQTAGTGTGAYSSFMGLTTTSFQLQTSDDGTFNNSYCRWRACGYLASGQY